MEHDNRELKFYASKKHLFSCLHKNNNNSDANMEEIINDFFKFVHKDKRPEIIPQVKILGNNEYIIFEYEHPFRVTITEMESDNLHIKKIPFKYLYSSIPYFNMKLTVLNEFLKNNN